MAAWYLYYAGTYTVCHKRAPTKKRSRPLWKSQGTLRILEPSPRHCNYLRNSSSLHGFVFCELNGTVTVPFFDGVSNANVSQSHQCTQNCHECVALGGKCRCYGVLAGSACDACASCAKGHRDDGTCACIAPP